MNKNRCQALDLQLTKSQKKIIKKVTTFLRSGECDKSSFNTEEAEREPLMKFESHGNFSFKFLII